MSSSKELFRIFCEKEKDIPIFLTYQWLETVADENWNVAIEEKGGEIAGVLPYVMNTNKGLKMIELPPLTAYGGIWIKYPEGQKYSTQISYEKEIYTSLIEKLPDFDLFVQKFYPGFNNWLPFYWKNYKQTTAYTYIIQDHDPENIFSEFKENIRREIRKAEKMLTVSSSDDIHILHQLKVSSYQEKKLKLSISSDYLKKIFLFCLGNNCGELLLVKDQNHTVHAAALFVWDRHSTYYLYGASNPEFKNSGAMSLLMWEGIKRSVKRSTIFNFEGSMIEEVERFFRGMGGHQVPYFIIKKTNSRILKIKEFLKDL